MGVREGLLALLADGPRHGYDLRATFDARTARMWNLNSGQVYTTLDRLQRDGLVEPVDDEAGPDPDDPAGRRRRYGLTAHGRAELDAWLGADSWAPEPARDELLMKVLLVANEPLRAADVIERHRHTLLDRLQQLRQGQRHADTDRPLAEHLAADALVARLDADLHWLDRCEQRLARLPVTSARGSKSTHPNPSPKELHP
ncbi:MAG: helix-turn-helix transcriptional regulator [Acidimicrobiales bacterium]